MTDCRTDRSGDDPGTLDELFGTPPTRPAGLDEEPRPSVAPAVSPGDLRLRTT